MVDNMNIDPASPMPGEGVPAAPKGGIAGFLATTVGKLALGGILLLLILGAAAIIFVTFLSGSDTPDLIVPAGQQPVATSTPAASEEESPTQRPTKALTESFTFRNIFAPTVSPPTVAAPGSDSGSTGTSTTPGTPDAATAPTAPENTLLLWKIETVDGALQGSFVWNGAVYTAGEGERLGETPWRVLELSGTSAVMQFGDIRVTLTVGQGITK